MTHASLRFGNPEVSGKAWSRLITSPLGPEAGTEQEFVQLPSH